MLLSSVLSILTLAAQGGAVEALPVDGVVQETKGAATVLLDSAGTAFHRTEGVVTNLRRVDLPGGAGFVVLWTEVTNGAAAEHYVVQRANAGFSRVRETSYEIHMKRGIFDPLQSAAPVAPEALRASGDLHLVQFVCPPLQEFRDELSRLGAVVRQFVPAHTRLVEMTPEVADVVAGLPFVRWVGPFSASYRLEQELLDGLAQGSLEPLTHVHVTVFEKGPRQKAEVAPKIVALGGEIVAQIPDGYRLEALLSPEQLVEVASFDEVAFIDRWQAPAEDLNKVRNVGGANTLETIEGFSGQGVRGEVMDGNVRLTHVAFQAAGVLTHGPLVGDTDHGTNTLGCVFSDGTGNSAGRGLLPDGQPIFADYGQLNNRYTHTAELLQAPYFAVLQSNSWGSGLTTSYTSTSMEMDDILFDFDITICQSQSNQGSQQSRPQAWAKNIVSVGGIRHYDTANLNDDAWNGSASIGPAADGRIKPDLCFWYDDILTTDDEFDSDYDSGFGGTSAATPCVAGYVGLVQQMWSAGIFGNSPSGSTVFERRAKATMVRALLVNTAAQYAFNGTGHDKTRTHQGWGLPDVATLQSLKDSLYLVNETDVLTEGGSTVHQVDVDGTDDFKATLCYLDLPGTVSASQHRINDLSLRVTDPLGGTYWGNNGLLTGNWSSTGGSSNTKDVIENVFVQNPMPGTWTVEVIADEVNEDAHIETGAVDVDYALVVSGVTDGVACAAPTNYCFPKITSIFSLPFLSTSGSTEVSGPGFQITMTDAIPQKPAQIFWGTASNDLPFQGGTFCVQLPIQRGAILTTDAQGAVTFPFDLSSKTIGATEYYQVWFRDPNDAFSSGLSDGVQVTYCP